MDKEELLGGLVTLLIIGLVAWAISACRECDRQYEYYARKYPECAMAGVPRVCIDYKRMLEDER